MRPLARSMRVPIFVPLLLVLLSLLLLGFDIASITGASEVSHRQTIHHSDQNLTFIASVQAPLEPETEIRTPGQQAHWFFRTIDREPRGGLSSYANETGDHDIEIHPDRAGQKIEIERLAVHTRMVVVGTWQLEDLAARHEVNELYVAQDPFAPHRIRVDIPPAPEPLAWQERTLSLVWLVRNTTDDYAQLATWLLDNGIQGGDGRGIIAVDTAVLARDPWLRGAAGGAAIAAISLALLPRAHGLPGELPSGRGGTGIDMAQIGARFLSSLRNAYIALTVALAILGIAIVLALALFASMAAEGDTLRRPGGATLLGWQASVFSLLGLAFIAGVVAAARPALESHLALHRWRRREGAPPIEGELAQ